VTIRVADGQVEVAVMQAWMLAWRGSRPAVRGFRIVSRRR